MNETRDGTLVSLQVGRVRSLAISGMPGQSDREWRTAYYKEPVSAPVRVGRLGLDGDEQFDRESHGGPDRALLGYSAEHYASWRAELGIETMGPGGFGENLTISGQNETGVCVGDTYAIGDARIQVTQPRGPCANISRRWQRPDMVKRVAQTSRFGWYLRVLDEGEIAAGMAVRLVERPYPGWNVAHVFRLRAEPGLDPETVAALARCPELSPGYRERFGQLAASGRI
jgi:MOSC domain-containing protein YiiM